MSSKKVYYLATCSTCARILKDWALGPEVVLQDIKTEKITPEQLEQMANMAGTYEALFSRRALLYKELGLAQKSLTEEDYRRLILEEYTFLKRPVAIVGNQIFVGNLAKTVAEAKAALSL